MLPQVDGGIDKRTREKPPVLRSECVVSYLGQRIIPARISCVAHCMLGVMLDLGILLRPGEIRYEHTLAHCGC
jgi:hypothetical protein